GWVGFVEAAIFILVLLAGLVYLVRIGALDWTPARAAGSALWKPQFSF
ncbi:hypothetical protein CKJ90_33185, partial [Klebsiella pneumoniae]